MLKARRAGKCSASHLLDSHAAESTSSSYRKSKQTTPKQIQESCSYCGKKGHGKAAQAELEKGNAQHIDTDVNFAIMTTTWNLSVEARASRIVALTH